MKDPVVYVRIKIPKRSASTRSYCWLAKGCKQLRGHPQLHPSRKRKCLHKRWSSFFWSCNGRCRMKILMKFLTRLKPARKRRKQIGKKKATICLQRA
eukprot:symbB.v1.2.031530.t1/scaffold3663.1/size52395/4